MQNKVVVQDKVKKDKDHPRKYKIEKEKNTESDVTIELTGDGDYVVEKLSVDGLPAAMTGTAAVPDTTPIRWFNNFAIKKNGQYINERYFVTIPSIGSSRLVIFDGNGNPYYYTGSITNNTLELTDGDPAMGMAP